MSGLFALLSDYTVQTVMIGSALIGAIGGIAGSFAVLRRQSLLGDALAHAALPGICIGFLIHGGRYLPALMAGAMAAGLIAALLVTLIARSQRIKPDTALAIVLSLFFAFGLVLLTRIQSTGGAAQAGLESFLFGQAAAMLRADLLVLSSVGAVVFGVVVVFWKEVKLVTFDRGYAQAQGMPVSAIETMLMLLIALAVVVGVQLVGVVLMTALLIAPPSAARQWVRSLGAMVTLSALFGAAAGVIGAMLSATARGLATGPLIALAATAMVLLSFVLAPDRGVAASFMRRLASRRKLAADQVLETLQAIASTHDDPAYPVERGMVELLHGTGSRKALARLERDGMVRLVDHAPESAPHWELTDAGRRRQNEAPR